MKSELQIPPNRPLPPGRVDVRRNHLVAEARADLRRSRTWSWRRPRVLATCAAAFAAVAVAAVATTYSLRPGGENRGAVRVVVTSAGPVRTWNGIALPGLCASVRFLDQSCGAVAPRPTLSIDVSHAPSRVGGDAVAIVGGTSAERRALRQVVDQVPGSSLTRVEIAPAAAGHVTLHFAAAGGDELRTDWEEMLVAGAYRDRARDEGLRPVDGFPAPSPVHAAAADAATQVQARLRSAAANAGAGVDEIAVGEPNGLAVLVVLHTDDPAVFLKQKLPAVLAAFGDRWRDYEGTFVEVVDEDGAFVWGAGTDPRTSHGSVGTRAGLEGCSPIPNWGPTPPPCPVK
jgi:hypothetical protein